MSVGSNQPRHMGVQRAAGAASARTDRDARRPGVWIGLLFMLLIAGCNDDGGGGAGTDFPALPSDGPVMTLDPVVFGRSSDGTVTVSWVAPETRTHGSAIMPSRIAGFRIYELEAQSRRQIADIQDRTRTQYTIGPLAEGRHTIGISTYDLSGVEGPLTRGIVVISGS